MQLPGRETSSLTSSSLWLTGLISPGISMTSRNTGKHQPPRGPRSVLSFCRRGPTYHTRHLLSRLYRSTYRSTEVPKDLQIHQNSRGMHTYDETIGIKASSTTTALRSSDKALHLHLSSSAKSFHSRFSTRS